MAIEARISWTQWPDGSGPVTHSYIKPYEEAKRQFEGLKSIESPHPLRPCGEHVWEPKLEVRTVELGEWRDDGEGLG